MSDDRVDRFRVRAADLDDTGIDDGSRDATFIGIGLALMLVGPVVGFLCYLSSVNALFIEDQNELIILTLSALG